MSESYLVIGGCGFLGRHIVEQLLARGETKVSVFDIVQRHFDSNVTFYIGDISKPEDVANALSKCGATAVIHTASPTHGLGPKIYELVNVVGTRTVIDCCLTAKVPKLVYTSSAGVIYSGLENICNADERLPYPAVAMDAYNDTKARAEAMVLAANCPELMTCALRPAGIFGPGDRQMISGFHQVMLNNQTRFQIGYNDNLFDWTYVGNVAHAHLLACDKLGSSYPREAFRDPLPPINISLGEHRIPTSEARPLGPNTSPSEADKLCASRFKSSELIESDIRPVLRNKMDQFASDTSMDDDEDDEKNPGPSVAGQAFFITNCEPVYFWDFARTIWKNLGHVPPYVVKIPAPIGLVLATLAEGFSKLSGREAGFTRFRVTFATQQRFYDVERARRVLGYEPIVGMEEGVKRWTDWYGGELERMRVEGKDTAKTK